MSPSSLATVSQILWRLIEFHGVDPAPLYRRAGIAAQSIRDPFARISNRRTDALIRLAAASIPDASFGLRAAHCWHPSNLGALGHAWLASSTLHRALERLVQYWRILDAEGNVALKVAREGVEFRHAPPKVDPVVDAVGGDLAVAIIVDMCRLNYGHALKPLRVGFRRAKPADAAPYERLFGCPVDFGRTADGFVLAHAVADRPLPTANRQLVALHDRILAQALARLDRDDVLARARAALLERLSTGDLSEDALSADLHMSRRTLQRRLADEGTAYAALLDATRRDLALRYLEDPSKSVTEIAFLLGYSQHSVFTRAFRRWTGRSPSRYRPARAVSSPRGRT